MHFEMNVNEAISREPYPRYGYNVKNIWQGNPSLSINEDQRTEQYKCIPYENNCYISWSYDHRNGAEKLETSIQVDLVCWNWLWMKLLVQYHTIENGEYGWSLW